MQAWNFRFRPEYDGYRLGISDSGLHATDAGFEIQIQA
jgi:hypothetical protein